MLRRGRFLAGYLFIFYFLNSSLNIVQNVNNHFRYN